MQRSGALVGWPRSMDGEGMASRAMGLMTSQGPAKRERHCTDFAQAFAFVPFAFLRFRASLCAVCLGNPWENGAAGEN